jgi:uncharacterized protein YebE (UPF0316 family)
LDALLAGPWGPLVIFGLRIGDVSLTTVRTILLVRGQRLLVPVIAVFETLIWIVAIGAALKHLSDPWHVAGYVGGFAAGNVVGMWLEDKLAVGVVSAQIFSRREGARIAAALRGEDFRATELVGHGRDGAVTILLSVVRRRRLPRLIAAAREVDPDVFVSVAEARETGFGRVFAPYRK